MDVSSTHRTQSPDPRRAVLLTSKINSVISWSDKLAAQKRPSIYESIYRLAPPHQETFLPSDTRAPPEQRTDVRYRNYPRQHRHAGARSAVLPSVAMPGNKTRNAERDGRIVPSTLQITPLSAVLFILDGREKNHLNPFILPTHPQN